MSKNFDLFNEILNTYMPKTGEGDTLASQIATAVAKIGYRWFNDGDTVSSNWMVQSETDAGGLAQYANWLYVNVPEAKPLFRSWISRFDHESVSDSEYVDFLYNMCEVLLEPDLLEGYSAEPVKDSIYNASRYGTSSPSLPFKPVLDDEDYNEEDVDDEDY